MEYREKLIQNVKDCGQSLIDNAEKIISDYKYDRGGMYICCYINEQDEASPYIEVTHSFYPEKFIERYS